MENYRVFFKSMWWNTCATDQIYDQIYHNKYVAFNKTEHSTLNEMVAINKAI